ncbi:TetR/AcrR family transcriptional regulator [Bifidobacterium psychraerophilum]|jgi:AcrR family transcriptional regulator|uniref:TetR/AcrR family transcriptional regulator n=2 Tax=Bifidobacterium psychraerophilum TaxID=218140 RepID=UPI0023F144A5|nr:helix-turn-helix domain-containing protein [Bifidobacterium psychraerophilum]MCI1660110.1 TetR/AcrR family transcriptional regulator [Bifidobacterium psychraerophilum]MCI1804822.1 TetR/AcrR family transcriptional regulator [Bifidobacterium psychraerophilum]MCI2176938.1 TetR/AcrR family transcriptional regulator [Bifidobacterium psychraerophilum]MCI2181852.1 TetR/AcrR family transcriptional regulator [Bifidobacterium psychraerophilum]
MRKQKSDRLNEISQAALQVLAERGYYGMTIQEVADRVGLSQAGLLKHVNSKNGLLFLALEQYDSDQNNPFYAYIEAKKNMSAKELELSPALMPELYRLIAQYNAENPSLAQLYLVLRAEAIDAGHPAHEYYAERGIRLRELIAEVPWKLPPAYEGRIGASTLSMVVGSAMEGLEFRWLGESGIDFVSMWHTYEDVLFPLPQWDGYR